MNRGVTKNTILSIVKNVSNILFPLITVPYINRVLMTDNVGKINFGSSIVSYFALVASLGVSTYAIRECAKVKDDRKRLSQVASEIISINYVTTGVAYFGLIVTLLFAKSLVNYRLLICIQSMSIMLTTIGADWINTAMEDFKYITIRTIVAQVLALVLMLVFVKKPEDYLKYALICSVVANGAYIVNVFYRKKFCDIKLTLRMNLRKHLLPILMLFGFMLASIICTNSDITLLGILRGDYEVGLYSTSVKVYNLVNTVVASITWVVMPQLSIGFSRKDYSSISKLLTYALNFLMVLGLPCVAGMEIMAPQIIMFVGGDSFIGAATSLRILGGALFLSFVGGWIGNMTMLPASRERVFLFSTVISAILNFVLNCYMIPIWGLNAAAVTTAISQLVGILVMIPFFDRNIRIPNLIHILRAPVVGSICVCVIGGVVQNVIDNSFLELIITILVSVICYVLILILLKNEFFIGYFTLLTKKLRH